MTGPDPELEGLLRRALSEHAQDVQPAGDGLSRIRARTARRGAWARWRVPALALAGTAALVVAVVSVPALLPRLDPGPGPVPPASGAASPVPTPSPAEGTPIPGAGVNDLVTVWPYPSRQVGYAEAEGDVAAGTYPDLTRPEVAAVAFVESYVGTAPALTARSAGRWKAGLRMEVRRGPVSVSLVYLVRVRVGNDAPYVVVEATRADLAPSLTLTAPPRLDGAGALGLAGQLRPEPAAAVRAPFVQLREPGRDTPLATARGTVLGAGEVRTWTATLSPTRAATSGTAAVAVWTTDAAGRVLEFVASPTAP